LHCYTRNKLNAKYGDAVVSKTGTIPAQLLGDMWAQDWGNLYSLLEPYPGVSSGDVTATLKAMRAKEYQAIHDAFKGTPSVTDLADMEHEADTRIAIKMTRIAEDFYTSIGMPALPDAFWKNSTLVKPRDRDMVCHASAWDFDLMNKDVRLKQCIEANEDDLFVVHHELGHIYYYLNYMNQPPVFQRGAHDGFHEAIGDTITLSLTPQHLVKVGLLNSAPDDSHALINAQMKKALDKIALPDRQRLRTTMQIGGSCMKNIKGYPRPPSVMKAILIPAQSITWRVIRRTYAISCHSLFNFSFKKPCVMRLVTKVSLPSVISMATRQRAKNTWRC
jgi:peptidyl-dipeptidase A